MAVVVTIRGTRRFPEWYYNNPDNAATKEIKARTMNWCNNDYHVKPMWRSCRKLPKKSGFCSNHAKKKGTERSKKIE